MSYLAFVVFFLAGEAVLVVLSQPAAGLCGGTFCVTDEGCGPNERCQPSPCGGKLCTPVISRDPCANFPCQNGGRCTAPADAPYCECPSDFTGRNCETQVTPTLTCDTVLCVTGTFCRHVKSCTGNTCSIKPSCIPVSENRDGLDNECRRLSYTAVILTENPRNRSNYIPLTCGRYQKCPAGSDCAGGYCCRGKVSKPLTKSGLCPTDDVTKCSNDYDCPGEQKCCNRCGKVCKDPIFVRASGSSCENFPCEPGFVCVLRTQCAPGMVCAQVLLPVCVPRQCERCDANETCIQTDSGYTCATTNECGGCPPRQVCRPTGIVCVAAPCNEAYACVPNDNCGGCPRGQECRRNSCLTGSDCGSYKCYRKNPTP